MARPELLADLDNLFVLVRLLPLKNGRDRWVNSGGLRVQYETNRTLPDQYEVALRLGRYLGLLETTKQDVALTPAGRALVKNSPDDVLQLTVHHKLQIAMRLLDGSSPGTTLVRRILAGFGYDDATLCYTGGKVPPSNEEDQLQVWMLLVQCGVLVKDGARYRLVAAFSEVLKSYVRAIRQGMHGLPKDSEDLLPSERAEQLIAEMERERLEPLNAALADAVAVIGFHGQETGYDIQSYVDKNSLPGWPDRFIEVKSRQDAERQFVFSRNELKVALKETAAYHIALVNNIKADSKLDDVTIEWINDPGTKVHDLTLDWLPHPDLLVTLGGVS